MAHNDLINLRPAVGAVNAARSNKPFAETLSGKKKQPITAMERKSLLRAELLYLIPVFEVI